MPEAKVSVVLPTRNRSALLSQTLRSVLWQQAVNLEVIVVDDGSSHDPREVVAAFADTRVRVIRNESPIGVAAARNSGAADARGQWLAFVDDDDLWAPDKLALQLGEAEAQGRDWAYAGAVVINTDTEITRPQFPMPVDMTVEALRRYHSIPGGASNVIVRRAAWERTGPFNTRLPVLADWELYLRLAKQGLPASVPRPLVARRLHPSNLSLDVAQIVRDMKMIEWLHDIRADWGKMRRWMAHSCLRAGQRRQAAGQFAMATVDGQLTAVAKDVWAMFGRVVEQRTDPRLPSEAWSAGAETWLRTLRGTTSRIEVLHAR